MFEIEGYAGKPSIARSNRNWQSIYINGRYIKNKTITAAIDEAYKTSLMKNKFPFVVLNIKINPVLVDVNVHPTKMEVRFTNEQDVFRAVYYAINNALLNESLVKNIEIESKNNIFKYEINSKKDEYIQERIGNIKSGSQMFKPEKAESKITGCETAELKEAEINEGEPKAEEKKKIRI